MSSNKDPYRYYRIEARELLDGLHQGLLELERGGTAKEPVGKLLRLAHTLKGASRVVKQLPSAELAHTLEETLAPYRESQMALPRPTINTLLRLLETLERHLAALNPSADPAAASAESTGSVTPAPAAVPFDTPLETVRVEVREMDALLENVMEAAIQVAALQPALRTLEECRHLSSILLNQVSSQAVQAAQSSGGITPGAGRTRALADDLRTALTGLKNDLSRIGGRAETELLLARDTANQLRLLPAGTIFAPLERAARDAAAVLHKEIEFVTGGSEIRLDAHVLNALRDPLLHVVRNAVAHGVELPSARRKAGKPPAGRIRLQVERRGHRVAFLIVDDGRGIDVPAVREALIDRGQLTALESSTLGDPAILQRLLQGGVSTSRAVTEMSGRGIGLDVLRAATARLKGDVDLRSAAGQGATVEIVVPISLASLTALEVDLGGLTVGIPLEAVRETARISAADVARTPSGETLPYQGGAIPFLPLRRILKPDAAENRDAMATAVILQSGSRLAAIGVERLRGVANVVVKPLPALVAADPVIAGASLNPAGDPQPMLDPAALVARALAGGTTAISASTSARAPILVIDDSLTTRMLEQSILESAGYLVDTATSAEEALVKARDKHYSLFVVDVEMPGMDGFTFVARTREDPSLRDTPAVLVTSRGSPEDRRRGIQVGARAYIVKSEFDQGFLLQTIRNLVR
ncbi:MAG TPA: response regulator [Planctomycetota bacterium]|nr:response regulator [Planctomycetota bacterium]